jgi:hypothetical protein
VQRKAVFRHGSTASLDSSFSGGQTWVNSKPKNWRPTRKTSEACLSTQLAPHRVAGDSQRSLATPGAYTSENHAVIDSLSPLEPYENGTHQKQSEENTQDNDQFHNSHRDHGDSPRTPRLTSTSSTTPPAGVPDIAFSSSCESAARYKEPEILLGHLRYSDYQNLMGTSTAATLDISSPSSNDLATASSEAVQESCLLRYFIEELSLWVRVNLTLVCGDGINMNFSLTIVMSVDISSSWSLAEHSIVRLFEMPSLLYQRATFVVCLSTKPSTGLCTKGSCFPIWRNRVHSSICSSVYQISSSSPTSMTPYTKRTLWQLQ